MGESRVRSAVQVLLAVVAASAGCGTRGRAGDGGGGGDEDASVPVDLGRVGQGPRTRDVVDPALPADLAASFDGAPAPSGSFALVYPNPGVVLPHDLAPIAAQWNPPPGANVYQVSYTVDSGDRLRGFVNRPSWTPAAADWKWLLGLAGGHQVTLTVTAGTLDANGVLGPTIHATAGQSLRISVDDATGALFYFATTGDQLTGNGTLERLELGAQMADKYLNKSNDGGHCVGCHTLTRDGSKLAFTFLDIGAGVTLTLGAVAAPNPTVQLTASGTNVAQSVWNPDGTRLLTSYAGRLELHDGANGQKLGDVVTHGPALYPDWSPDGKHIVFVRPARLCQPFLLDFGQGSIFVYGGSLVTMDQQNDVFSNETVLLAAGGNQNNYYPSYSPDGSLIAFVRSDGVTGSSWAMGNAACTNESGAGVSYDNPSSTVWVTSSQGGVPVPLKAANGTGMLTNSWPKWGPKPDGEFLWLSFSSTRPYGNVLPAGQAHHQLWVTAINKAELATNPSSPPLWFPFQDIGTKNHIGMWSVKVGDYKIQ